MILFIQVLNLKFEFPLLSIHVHEGGLELIMHLTGFHLFLEVHGAFPLQLLLQLVDILRDVLLIPVFLDLVELMLGFQQVLLEGCQLRPCVTSSSTFLLVDRLDYSLVHFLHQTVDAAQVLCGPMQEIIRLRVL